MTRRTRVTVRAYIDTKKLIATARSAVHRRRNGAKHQTDAIAAFLAWDDSPAERGPLDDRSS